MEVIQGNFGGNRDQDEDHAATIAFMETTLEQAREQRATHCLLIILMPDDSIFGGWSQSNGMRPFVMIGALTEITQRYIRKNMEQEE